MAEEGKTRTNITFPNELMKFLKEKAREENRSFNNFVITVLQNYMKSQKQ